jgi:putative ABC transport system permease protein
MSIFRRIRRGVRALINSHEADRDADDEVNHYLAESTLAHERNGLAPDEARRAAALDMGNATFTREQVRNMGWEHSVETLVTDVRYALRRLRRSPSFTITAVVTLALGIGAATAVFSAVSPILLEPLPFPHASRLVTVNDRTDDGTPMPVTLGTFAEVRARSRAFESLAAADNWQPSITGTGDPERLKGQRVTASYFDVYGVAPVAGKAFTVDDEQTGRPPLAIVSDGLLQRRFGGDHSIVGRTIDLDGDAYTVIGVMPRDFADALAPATEIWSPLRDKVTGDLSGREWGHHYKMVGRLAATTTVASAVDELLNIGRRPVSAFMRPPWASLQQGLVVRSMQDDITGPVRPALYAVIGAVLLLLVIASVNVTNLLLARGAQRRAELAMRIALGAGRGRILRQLLTESVTLALAGGVAGLGIALLGMRAFVAVSPPGLPRVDAIHVDFKVFVFGFTLTAAVGLVVGLLPALGAVRADATDGLHHTARMGFGIRGATRNALVVAEVALAAVLLVGGGLLYRSVTRLVSVPPGFDASGVVTMQVVQPGRAMSSDAARLVLYQQVLAAVRQIPGVVDAALTSGLPLSGDVDGYGLEAQSRPDLRNGAAGSAIRYVVTPDYFAAMRIPLRRGRLLSAADRPGEPESVVINESMARRLFGDRNPIGERVRFGPELNGDTWDYVVGVVGDVKHYSLAADAPDAFYVATSQWHWVDNVQTLVVRTNGGPAALAPSLQRAVWSVNRNLPIQRVRTMNAFVTASADQRRFALEIIEAFAVVAFVLAAIGLYGVVAGGVIERLREIGVRSALGAAPSDIVRDVVGRSLRLAGGGLVIGGVASLGATKLIRTMLFGVTTTDALTYATVAALLLGVAGLAAWAPARRAAGVDPTIALRAE